MESSVPKRSPAIEAYLASLRKRPSPVSLQNVSQVVSEPAVSSATHPGQSVSQQAKQSCQTYLNELRKMISAKKTRSEEKDTSPEKSQDTTSKRQQRLAVDSPLQPLPSAADIAQIVRGRAHPNTSPPPNELFNRDNVWTDSSSTSSIGMSWSSDSDNDLSERRQRLGRIKEEDIKTVVTSHMKMAETCINFQCSKSARGCKFSGRCVMFVKDLQLVNSVRTNLYGVHGAWKVAAVRREFVFNTLKTNKVVTIDPGTGVQRVEWKYFVEHNEVCLKAFLAITGVSCESVKREKRRIWVEKKEYFADRCPYGIAAGGSIRNMSKDEGHAMAWLKGIASDLGQHLPNANETRLPFSTMKMVHEMYEGEMRIRGITAVGYKAFCGMWSSGQETSIIKLAKKKGIFAQCNTCADFAGELSKAADNVEVADIKARWNLHVEHVQRCRRIYYDMRNLAFARPDLILCAIADVMDQAKTCLPHFTRKPKYAAHGVFLGQCVMGVKLHGHGSYHFNGLPRVSPGGSNYMLECLLRSLRDVAKTYPDGLLPPRFYIQLDNCGGDNKNFVVIGMLNVLVAVGTFEMIEVGFLPVGHTHEDIDQAFSVLSRYLKKNSALSFSKYLEAVSKAFSQRQDCPKVEYVNVKRDYKAWLEQPGVLIPSVERVGIKDVRYLRITTYGRAKQLFKQELQQELEQERCRIVNSLQDKLKGMRSTFVDMPKDRPDDFVGSEEEYRVKLQKLEDEMVEVHEQLVNAQREVEVELPINQELLDTLQLRDVDVVMHYKRNMDDKKYLPAYCEGVKWLLRAPFGDGFAPPARCEYSRKWFSAEGSTTGKSECQEVFNTLKTIFTRDIHGVISQAEREEWEQWMSQQEVDGDSFLEDESPWILPKCRLSGDMTVVYSHQPQDMSEVLTHAGFSASSRRARRNQETQARRIEEEMKRAAEMEPICSGDYVMYWEELANEDNQDEYRGMSPAELRCPLVLGRAVEDWNPSPEAPSNIKVHRYRQAAGDMNRTFFPGVLSANNGKWIVDITRDSVVLVGPEFSKNSKKLTHQTKKKLCEIPVVAGQFALIPKDGMVRIGARAQV